jgi:peptide/nickel transport system permease protein
MRFGSLASPRLRQLARQFAQAVPVMLIVATLTFFLMHLLPGDPAVLIAGPEASKEAVAQVRTQLGLDRPLLEQLLAWFGHLARGDLGRSLLLNQPVMEAVLERLPVTMSLALVSFALTLPLGIGAGVLAACFRNTWFDAFVMLLALIGVSAPSFQRVAPMASFGRVCPARPGFLAMVRRPAPAGDHPRPVPDRLSRAHHALGHA